MSIERQRSCSFLRKPRWGPLERDKPDKKIVGFNSETAWHWTRGPLLSQIVVQRNRCIPADIRRLERRGSNQRVQASRVHSEQQTRYRVAHTRLCENCQLQYSAFSSCAVRHRTILSLFRHRITRIGEGYVGGREKTHSSTWRLGERRNVWKALQTTFESSSAWILMKSPRHLLDK